MTNYISENDMLIYSIYLFIRDISLTQTIAQKVKYISKPKRKALGFLSVAFDHYLTFPPSERACGITCTEREWCGELWILKKKSHSRVL